MLHDPNIHYLDNAATTMVNPEVIETITKAMAEHWANPSSLYAPNLNHPSKTLCPRQHNLGPQRQSWHQRCILFGSQSAFA